MTLLQRPAPAQAYCYTARHAEAQDAQKVKDTFTEARIRSDQTHPSKYSAECKY